MERAATTSERRDLAPLLPALIGLVLLFWGIKVMYTAFVYGSLPIAGWHTDAKRRFGVVWMMAFVVVLLPAYLNAISMGWQSLRKTFPADKRRLTKHWLAAIGVSVLLCALTFSARLAATSWFPVSMHPPFDDLRGGFLHGLVANMILLILEAGVLLGIKYQTRSDQQPYPLLIPSCFALLLLVWAGWSTYTAFANGCLPVVGWRTEQRWLFGMLWLAAFCIVLLPAYLYSIFLGFLGFMERNLRDKTVRQNFWLVAIGNTASLCLITFCARLAVTAWFPEKMPPPFAPNEWRRHGRFAGHRPAGPGHALLSPHSPVILTELPLQPSLRLFSLFVAALSLGSARITTKSGRANSKNGFHSQDGHGAAA